MTYEDILEDVGGYGKFQKQFKYLFVIPVSIVVPWFWMNLIFMLSLPDHWCNVPVVRSQNFSTMLQRSIISPPEDPFCMMYDVDYETLLLNSENISYPKDTKIVACNNGWQYDNTYYDATAATKWDMVCDRSHYVSLVLILQKVGDFFGTPAFGFLSDKIGRRLALLYMGVLVSVGEAASLLVNNFVVFVILKVISSTVLSASISVICIFGIEMVPPEKRAHMTGIVNVCWTLGNAVIPLIAYLSRNWVILGICNTLAGVLYLSYWKFLPETPCWLVSQERYEEATTTMKRIGDKNGRNSDEILLFKKLQALGEDEKKQKEKEKHSNFNLLKYHRLRKHFLLLTFCWIANNVGYLGLVYNMRNVNGNEFLNFFLISVVEIPGNVTYMILMDRIGRRWTGSGGLLITGIICLVPLTGLPYTDILSSMVGKFLISGTYMITDQQASELFPTVTRTFGIGVAKTISTAATVFLPYLADLTAYGKTLPFIIISLICLAAGILASFLPETLYENLPQTTTEAEEFGKDQKYFSWRRKKPSTVDEPTPVVA